MNFTRFLIDAPKQFLSEADRLECVQFETRYLLCKEFGWDYYTYEVQPRFWIESIKNYLIAKSEVQKDGGK